MVGSTHQAQAKLLDKIVNVEVLGYGFHRSEKYFLVKYKGNEYRIDTEQLLTEVDKLQRVDSDSKSHQQDANQTDTQWAGDGVYGDLECPNVNCDGVKKIFGVGEEKKLECIDCERRYEAWKWMRHTSTDAYRVEGT